MLTLVKVAVASNSFELALRGKEEKGLGGVFLGSFFDELEKIAVDAKMFARIADKAAKRGWSGAREAQSVRRIATAEGRHVQKAMGSVRLPGHVADPTKISRPAIGGTVSGRAPKPHAQTSPPADFTRNQRAPTASPQQPRQAPAPAKGGLMKRLALGGGVLGAGVLAGHAMPQHQQAQQ